MQIDLIKICAPRPEKCEALVFARVPGRHEYDYTCNGQTHSLVREIKNVALYQEGEGTFAFAVKEGALTVETGDVVVVAEFNHGTFNWSIFADGILQSSLTHVVPKGGLTALASMIKQDATFPDSVREVDEDLIVAAIANRKPGQALTYKGLSIEDAFRRSVVRWIRAGFAEAKKEWAKVRARDWLASINKIVASGGAAPLAQFWIDTILEEAQNRRDEGDPIELQNAQTMELMAKNITVCPSPRFSNAVGMLELAPLTTGITVAVDFGYSALKIATEAGNVALMHSAIALPYSRINMRDVRSGSCFIELKSGPLYDALRASGQPTSYLFGSAANSIMGAEKVVNNAKEQFIAQAVLAACSPTLLIEAPTKKKLTNPAAS